MYLTKEEIILRLNYYCKKQHISKYELAKRSELPRSTIYNIYNRNTVPSIEVLQKILSGLDISMAEFFMEKEESPLSDLTPREEDLLYKYRRLSFKDKETVDRMTNVMRKEDEE